MNEDIKRIINELTLLKMSSKSDFEKRKIEIAITALETLEK